MISYITLYSVSHDLAIINYTAMIYSDPQPRGTAVPGFERKETRNVKLVNYVRNYGKA